MSLQIEYRNRTHGNGHFFDADTMRFFNSRIGAVDVKGDDWYFVTSERCDWGSGSPRMFSVRKMDIDGEIETVGEFNSLTRYRAEKLLAELTS